MKTEVLRGRNLVHYSFVSSERRQVEALSVFNHENSKFNYCGWYGLSIYCGGCCNYCREHLRPERSPEVTTGTSKVLQAMNDAPEGIECRDVVFYALMALIFMFAFFASKNGL